MYNTLVVAQIATCTKAVLHRALNVQRENWDDILAHEIMVDTVRFCENIINIRLK